jgi:hypothetical protein
VGSIRWKHIPETDRTNGNDRFRLAWDDDLLAILNRLYPRQPFPKPQMIAADPEAGFDLPGERSAAITFKTRETINTRLSYSWQLDQ